MVLRPGLYAKVVYREEVRRGALLVPQRAVSELQGQYQVVVVNAESKAETRTVKVGPRAGSLWIVEDGVKPGEKVIVEGALKAKDGQPVKAAVASAEAAQPTSGGTAAGASAPGGPAGGGAQPRDAASGGTASGGGAPSPNPDGSGRSPAPEPSPAR
jgi:membrane fusion protein (multidrug efflux system)